MATAQRRGAFILFEGIDRSGKTTQCTKLVEHLTSQQVPADMWRFPDRTTPLGQMIDGYLSSAVELNDAAVHLMFSANRWEKSKAMLSTLESGTSLIVDRYSYSGMAYTMAKRLPGLNMAWCQAPEHGLPAPDLVFYMRTSSDTSAGRGGFGEERYEKAEFQALVASNFDALSRDDNSTEWRVIDASQSIDTIHAQITAAIDALLSSDRLSLPVAKMYNTQPSTTAAAAGVAESSAEINAVAQVSVLKQPGGGGAKGVDQQGQQQAAGSDVTE